jgi:hypothetical protein
MLRRFAWDAPGLIELTPGTRTVTVAWPADVAFRQVIAGANALADLAQPDGWAPALSGSVKGGRVVSRFLQLRSDIAWIGIDRADGALVRSDLLPACPGGQLRAWTLDPVTGQVVADGPRGDTGPVLAQIPLSTHGAQGWTTVSIEVAAVAQLCRAAIARTVEQGAPAVEGSGPIGDMAGGVYFDSWRLVDAWDGLALIEIRSDLRGKTGGIRATCLALVRLDGTGAVIADQVIASSSGDEVRRARDGMQVVVSADRRQVGLAWRGVVRLLDLAAVPGSR